MLARRSGLALAQIDHLLGRHGGLIDEVLAVVARRPELAEPLPGAEGYLSAEVVYAVTHEGARHLDDVLARRTRISIETFDRGTHAARAAAELMAGGARLGRHSTRRRGRPLPAPGRGRAPVAADADRPGGRRGAGQRPRHRVKHWTSCLRGPPWRQDRRQKVVEAMTHLSDTTSPAVDAATRPGLADLVREVRRCTQGPPTRPRSRPWWPTCWWRPSRPLQLLTEEEQGGEPRGLHPVHAPRRGRLLDRRCRVALGQVTEVHDHLVWCTFMILQGPSPRRSPVRRRPADGDRPSRTAGRLGQRDGAAGRHPPGGQHRRRGRHHAPRLRRRPERGHQRPADLRAPRVASRPPGHLTSRRDVSIRTPGYRGVDRETGVTYSP